MSSMSTDVGRFDGVASMSCSTVIQNYLVMLLFFSSVLVCVLPSISVMVGTRGGLRFWETGKRVDEVFCLWSRSVSGFFVRSVSKTNHVACQYTYMMRNLPRTISFECLTFEIAIRYNSSIRKPSLLKYGEDLRAFTTDELTKHDKSGSFGNPKAWGSLWIKTLLRARSRLGVW